MLSKDEWKNDIWKFYFCDVYKFYLIVLYELYEGFFVLVVGDEGYFNFFFRVMRGWYGSF